MRVSAQTPFTARVNDQTTHRKLAAFFREELSGWKRWEIAWFAFCCTVTLGISIYGGDTLLGVISATSGIAYTLCNGKGKRIAYLFGIINSALYAYIAFQAGYYGETILNGLYYFPMMFVGLFAWNRHLDTSTHEVIKRRMTIKQRAALGTLCAGGTLIFGMFLQALDDTLPFIDAFTTVASVIAMVVAIKRYTEQWALWTAVNAVTIGMWAFSFAQGGESIATLAMWIAYFATGIIMWVTWSRDAAR